MQILSETQHRTLAFVHACGRGGYRPTVTEVEEWLDNPQPEGALWEPLSALARGTALTIAQAFSSIMSRRTREAESDVDHLVKIGWLVVDEERVGLSELGRALLHDAELEVAEESGVSVVVLGRDDPLAYPQLIGHLAGLGAGLLVDQYLRLEQLHQLVQSTQIDRVLVSALDNMKSARSAMTTYLDSPSMLRPIEVRASGGLHDRLMAADSGEVHTVGTSLNGIGRVTTVITPLPTIAAAAMAAEAQAHWSSAETVGPTSKAAGTAEDAEDDQAAGSGVEREP